MMPSASTKVPWPLMFDRDGQLFRAGYEVMDRKIIDPEDMFYAEWRLEEFTKNFMQGCRGL